MENARRHTSLVLLQLLPQRHIPRIIVITVVVTTVNVVYMANVNPVTKLLHIPGGELLHIPGGELLHIPGGEPLEVNHFLFSHLVC